jgi:SNF2 family DNA or RNA helicase
VIEINPEKFKMTPYPYQWAGIKHISVPKEWFCEECRVTHRTDHAALLDEMGAGKTMQTINACCVEFENGIIDTVFIVTPASVRGVWDDPVTGEIKKFSWVQNHVQRLDQRRPTVSYSPTRLNWVVVSYDFLRSRLDEIKKQLKGRKIHLVLDESSFVKSNKAKRTKSILEIKDIFVKRTILNGTPVANTMMDYWAQFAILAPEAIYNWSYYKMRAIIAIMGGFERKEITGYQGLIKNEQGEYEIVPDSPLGRLLKHMQPWIMRREKKDVLSYLPAKTYNIIPVELSKEAWKIYKQMKDYMVAYLEEDTSTALNGAVKAMRLSQITSGFLGGFEVDLSGAEEEGLENMIFGNVVEPTEVTQVAKEIDDAKLKAFFEFLETGPELPIVVWCRFRPELKRMVAALRQKGYRVGAIYGGQSDVERQGVINGFQSGELDFVIGQQRAGGLGLTLTKAKVMCYISNTFSLIDRQQSEDRIHRPGQTGDKTLYYDFIAVGPEGQRTIDHLILKALRDKKNMLEWSTRDWKTGLTEI